jgi:DNA-binding transcriptional regulator/RsmH inhibitor MraZ
MEELILRFYKRIDAKGRISIPSVIVNTVSSKKFNVEVVGGCLIMKIDNDGSKRLDNKNRLSLSTRLVDKIGSNEVYMEIYKSYIKLVPIKKGGKARE